MPRPVYNKGEILRRVDQTRPYIQFMGRAWSVPTAFGGETLAIRPLDRDGLHGVFFGATEIAKIDLKAPK